MYNKVPYRRFNILLSQPLSPKIIKSTNFNAFSDQFALLGIKRPNVFSPENKHYLKIHLREEDNEIVGYYRQKSKIVAQQFRNSLRNKDFYPISRKGVILHRDFYFKKSDTKFSPLYDKFDKIQEILENSLEIFPNRPNDFANQFGLNVRTQSQTSFLSVLYELSFDVQLSSHYLLSQLFQIPLPDPPQVDANKFRNKSVDRKSIPSYYDKISTVEKDFTELENTIDKYDFRIAINAMKSARKAIKSVTRKISSRHSSQRLMSATPADQDFFSLYEKDRLASDSIPRIDIFSHIGIRIRKNQKMERAELEKLEIGWLNKRVPFHRMLLSHGPEMFFEKTKVNEIKFGKSGSNDSLSSLRSKSLHMSMSQTAQQTVQQTSSSQTQAGWAKDEDQNPFRNTLLIKQGDVTVLTYTSIEKNAGNDTQNINTNENENDSDSVDSFF